MAITFNMFTGNFDIVLNSLSSIVTRDTITGSSLSGFDGDENRTYTATSIPVIIFVDNQALNFNYDYTVSGNTITFLNNIFDSQRIDILG